MRIRMIRVLLLAVATLFLSTACLAQVGVSITVPPPELPVYQQSVCPGDGYIWTPGYWAYADDDYYWVPGAWVMAPEAGLLWTPGYWGWSGNGFVFSQGYWGEQVGFYGGINYGYGYPGQGYEGGRWNNGQFFYNTRENNLSGANIHDVYSETTTHQGMSNRASYNGGNGGIDVRATSQEEAAARERQVPPVPLQVQRAQAARTDPQQRASVNHGMPPVTATSTSGAFEDHGDGASGDAAPRSNNNASRYSTAVHPNDLPPLERPASSSTGNEKLDRKYEKQQDKLIAKQNQDRQKLQKTQDRDHQNLARQNASEATKGQVEQQHQLQTQQMVQRHTQQQQQLQQRQQKQQPPQPTESRPPKG